MKILKIKKLIFGLRQTGGRNFGLIVHQDEVV
jgi:hypothetical protein